MEKGKKKSEEEPTAVWRSWYLSPSWPQRFFPRDRLSGRHAPGTFWKARSTTHNGRAHSPKQKPCFCRFVHLSPFHFLPTSTPCDSPGKQPHEGYARSLVLDSLFTPPLRKNFSCARFARKWDPVAYFEAARSCAKIFIRSFKIEFYANRFSLWNKTSKIDILSIHLIHWDKYVTLVKLSSNR